MKGRNPLNRPSVRKTDVYKLLLNLGGEARWKDMELKLKDLGWGPTTLKQVLDEMVKDGSIIKEARLGVRGPEAWYSVVIKDDDIWEPVLKNIDTADERWSDSMGRELKVLQKRSDAGEIDETPVSQYEFAAMIKEIKDTSMEQVYQNIKQRAQQLDGLERTVFLKAQMRKISMLALEELQSLIFMEAKGSRTSKEKLSYIHFMLITIFNKHLEEYLNVLNDYPELTMEVMLEQIIRDEKKLEEALQAEGLRTKGFGGN